jgi:hypothetical protein
MSGVWGWFGGQSAQKRKDTPKNAILGLRSQLEMLQKRERHLQNQMDEQDAIARKNVSTNKNGKPFWKAFCGQIRYPLPTFYTVPGDMML